ncbi:putative N-acetyltransferase HLS1-like [Vitis vinifera]|uniref:Putative N-acetyltransferase HLS1-like n=1 Tax=Vitis vinifera TaxID=29760 RepID=A0A438G1V3_VITVI|nr:putative N-acetyltransferase HLS1-like [Vitis vinifera]
MAFGETKIRNYEERRDRAQVEDLERRCEVGPAERVFLFTDTMGDAICRIRNSPMYKMLVAEVDNQLVGVIRGSIKVVTVRKPPKDLAKVGYVLGLRVLSLYRRRGIGLKLVRRLEEWFVDNQVDYAYMATEKDNEASVKLFVDKLGYVKFRTPAILVNPVRRRVHLSSNIEIAKLKVEEAELLYREIHGVDGVLLARHRQDTEKQAELGDMGSLSARGEMGRGWGGWESRE